jgi:branched-chain amino acid transport system permease protein
VLVVVVMVAVGGVVNLLLRGTTGRALSAVHASPAGASSAGVPVRRMTMLVFALSAAIAGLGGAFWGMSIGSISPTDFNYFFGPTFLVIVVTVGSTTVEGAVFAGMAYALVTQAFTYLPVTIGGDQLGGASLTVVLLCIGAFSYASHPEGLFEVARRRFALTVFRAVEHHSGPSIERRDGSHLVAVDEPT